MNDDRSFGHSMTGHSAEAFGNDCTFTHENEELLIVGALTDEGTIIDPEVAQKLFQLASRARQLNMPIPEQLQAVTDLLRRRAQEASEQRQQEHFSTEIDKLDLWAEDLKSGHELRIKELELSIKEAQLASRLDMAHEERLMLQKNVKALEFERNQARRRLLQDEIDLKRDNIIQSIEEKLQYENSTKPLYLAQWWINGNIEE